ncbi:MAG TPA: sugar phosphate isomerase/epimerase family protein [Verrucomicrobiae bacterium]|nr:sugar phosphate isomerase/epimerase family protein [Verrucomicrobiae bacterium]
MRFTGAASVTAAATARMGLLNVASARAEEVAAVAGGKKYPIGLEMYSVRNVLAKDLPGTLKAVSKMGYEVVEFYAPYFNWSLSYAKDVRSQMDDLGLRCFSTHNSYESFAPGGGMAKAIELNQILGAKIIVLASAPGGTKGVDGWKNLCERLSAATEELKKHGLTAGFHNHQAEWTSLEPGTRIMDVVAANTPHEFVLQLDVGTCVEAGADPVAWIKANPGRIRTMHLKDWAPGADKGYRVLFGEGVAPWKEIFAAAETTGGIEYYLMEQEGSRYGELETVQRCLENWKRMRNA